MLLVSGRDGVTLRPCDFETMGLGDGEALAVPCTVCGLMSVLGGDVETVTLRPCDFGTWSGEVSWDCSNSDVLGFSVLNHIAHIAHIDPWFSTLKTFSVSAPSTTGAKKRHTLLNTTSQFLAPYTDRPLHREPLHREPLYREPYPAYPLTIAICGISSSRYSVPVARKSSDS